MELNIAITIDTATPRLAAIRDSLLAALKSGEAKYRVKVEVVNDEPQNGKNPKASQ
jgi:hypothetical protein